MGIVKSNTSLVPTDTTENPLATSVSVTVGPADWGLNNIIIGWFNPLGGLLVGENLSPYPIIPIAAIARNSTSSANFRRTVRSLYPIAPGNASRPAIPSTTATAI